MSLSTLIGLSSSHRYFLSDHAPLHFQVFAKVCFLSKSVVTTPRACSVSPFAGSAAATASLVASSESPFPCLLLIPAAQVCTSSLRPPHAGVAKCHRRFHTCTGSFFVIIFPITHTQTHTPFPVAVSHSKFGSGGAMFALLLLLCSS